MEFFLETNSVFCSNMHTVLIAHPMDLATSPCEMPRAARAMRACVAVIRPAEINGRSGVLLDKGMATFKHAVSPGRIISRRPVPFGDSRTFTTDGIGRDDALGGILDGGCVSGLQLGLTIQPEVDRLRRDFDCLGQGGHAADTGNCFSDSVHAG